MNLADLLQYSEALLTGAQRYRNGELLATILSKLKGQQLSPEVVRELLEPYLRQLQYRLSGTDLLVSLEGRFLQYVPVAMELVIKHSYRNHFDGTDVVTQNNVDALLVEFVNDACHAMDLKDLVFSASDLALSVTPDPSKVAPPGKFRVVGVDHSNGGEEFTVRDCETLIDACDLVIKNNSARLSPMEYEYYAIDDNGDYIYAIAIEV